MAAAYSMDLRTRVLKDADSGLSSKEVAARYQPWVDALKQRRRETGGFAPLEPTKFRGRALISIIWPRSSRHTPTPRLRRSERPCGPRRA